MTATIPVASATMPVASAAMPVASANAEPAAARITTAPSLGAWFLRRTLIGMLILAVTVGGAAWLLHASIDPTTEVQAAPTSERSG